MVFGAPGFWAEFITGDSDRSGHPFGIKGSPYRMSGVYGFSCRKALFDHVKNTSLEGGARGQKAALNREFKGSRYLCLVMRCSQDVSRICGTQAAIRMFGDSNKSLKPNSRMPRMVDRYNWKVTEMARWMTRRIQRRVHAARGQLVHRRTVLWTSVLDPQKRIGTSFD